MSKIFPLFKKIIQEVAAGGINFIGVVVYGIKTTIQFVGRAKVNAGIKIYNFANLIPSTTKPGIVIKAILQDFVTRSVPGIEVTTTNSGNIAIPVSTAGTEVTTSNSGTISFPTSKSGVETTIKNSGDIAIPVSTAGIQSKSLAALVDKNTKAGLFLTRIGEMIPKILKPGVRLSTSNTGEANRPQSRAGISSESAVDTKFAPAIPGPTHMQLKFSLTHLSGASAQSADGTAWTNPANSLGKKNGTYANIDAALLGSKAGGIILDYVAFTNKDALLIQSVKLKFYVYRNVLLSGGTLALKWRKVSSDAWTTITTLSGVGTDDYMTTPYEVDLTQSLVWTWAYLTSMQAEVYGSFSGVGIGDTCRCDAVELEIIASVKQINNAVSTVPVTSGRLAHYIADDIPLSDGSPVSSWADSSGNGHTLSQATAGNQPTLDDAQLNGHDIVVFDSNTGATRDYLTKVLSPTWSNPLMVFAVGKFAANPGTGVSLSIFGAETFLGLSNVGGTTFYASNDGTLLTASPTNQSTTAWQVWGYEFNGASSKIRIGGILKNTGNAGSTALTNLTLGSIGSATAANCSIAEVIIFNRILTDAERASVEEYLAYKYALTIGG